MKRLLDHPGLSRRPQVKELGRAQRREKLIALVGVGLALVLGVLALIYIRSRDVPPSLLATAQPISVPALGVPAALAVIVVGAAFLDFGWPLYRLTVILTGLAIGGLAAGAVGWAAAGTPGLVIGAALGGLGGALAAWPAEVLIRALSGALAGLALGLLAGSTLGGGAALVLAAIGGLLLGGALTFLIFRPLMMTVFAVSGATMIIYGVMSLYGAEEGRVALSPAAAGLVAGLAVVGILTQRTLSRRATRRARGGP